MNPHILEIPNTDHSKLSFMLRIADEYGHHPYFRDLSARICEGLSGYQRGAAGSRICGWVRETIRYWREAGEQIQTPLQTLRVRYGDCDDLVVLAAALLTAADVPWRFETLGRPARHIRIGFQDEKGGWESVELTV